MRKQTRKQTGTKEPNRFNKGPAYTTPFFRGYVRQFLLLSFILTLPVFLACVHLQAECRKDACWPAFDYDGKAAQTDGSYLKACVKVSQGTTAHVTAESRTMTAADGKLQVRLDGKRYRLFPAEEYAVQLTNLSKAEQTGVIANLV